MAAPYSTVRGKASFSVLGYFIVILWLVVGVKVCLAGEDLPPPPFFIIFCVHGEMGLAPLELRVGQALKLKRICKLWRSRFANLN